MTEIVVQEQLLECAICMERLDENCKMLPCQHTYCKICLERMYEREGTLNCPQCRKVVPNVNEGNPIDTLPTNLILLSLIEQVNRNPPRLRNENDELHAAITNSIEEFQKERTADMLLKHNEQLQTQLALENSKQEILLKNAQDMSEELNELFLCQRSYDQEIFKRENQNLLSEKEKLEVEVAILKSEQEHPDYITDLIFWFETNYAELNQDLKKKVQNVLKNLRRAKVTQQNDSIQRRLRNLLENLKENQKSELPAKITEIHKDAALCKPSTQNNDIIDTVNKKLEEVKFLLKNESRSSKMDPKTEKNYPSQSHHFHLPQQPPFPAHQSSFQNYLPPALMSIPPKPGGFIPNYYHQQYYGPPHYPPYFPTASNFTHGSHHFNPVPHPHPPDPRANYWKSAVGRDSFSDKSGGISHRSLSSNNFTRSKVGEENDFNKSLILPDVRDYDQFEKRMGSLNLQKDGNREQKYNKKIQEKVHQLSTSRGGVGEPLLMLPDVRDYDKVYLKVAHSQRLSTFGDSKNDTEWFGIERLGETKKSYDGRSDKINRGKQHRGQGKNRRSASKSTSYMDGFESDSSNNSATSVSSKLSTCSTPAVFHEKPRNFSHKGKNTGGYRKSRDVRISKEESGEKVDPLTKLIYPSREEAQMQNLDVKKPFKTPLVCLGKNRGDPVSDIVHCLADIYTFEKKYSECKLVRY